MDTHPTGRLGMESPLAPRFLDLDLTTTEGKVFDSFSWEKEYLIMFNYISTRTSKALRWGQKAIPRKSLLTQFLGGLTEMGLVAIAKISTRLSITCKAEHKYGCKV